MRAPATRGRLLAGVVAGVVALLALAVPATPAWAHATLLSTSPANGAILATAPTTLQLQFDEQVSLEPGAIRVLDPTGAQVPAQKPTHPEGDATTVNVKLASTLAGGNYTVAWRVISADTHPVQGAFAFTVGGGKAATSTPAVSTGGSLVPAIGYGIARLAGYLSMALLIGAAFFVARFWPEGGARRRVRRLVWAGWAGSLVSAIAALVTYGPYATGRPLADAASPGLIWATLHLRLGIALAVRAGFLALVAPAVPVLLRLGTDTDSGARARRVAPVLVLAAGAGLGGTWSAVTHSAVGTWTVLAVTADIVHLVAMAVWLGGLVVLVTALLPARDRPAMRTAVPAFSKAALTCVLLLVTSGLYASWREVGTVPALLDTAYGRLLMTKVALVAALVALGALARRWVHRHYRVPAPPAAPATGGSAVLTDGSAARAGRASGRRTRPPKGPNAEQIFLFRRRVAVEAVLAVVVLGLSSVLMATEPGRAAHAAQLAASRNKVPASKAGPVPVDAAAQAPGPVAYRTASGSGFVAVEVQPPRVGHSVMHLAVLDGAGRIQAVPEVKVSMSLPSQKVGPIPVDVGKGEGGHYAAVVPLSLPGRWEISVTVRTSDVDETTVSVPLDVPR